MRTHRFVAFALFGIALVAAHDVRALDPDHANRDTGAAEAFRLGAEYYSGGNLEQAFEAFREAAEQGNPVAQWKLGKMYAAGEGTEEDDYKAFQVFSQIADTHADDDPYLPVASIVADAFVNLANYYRSGIETAGIKPNLSRAFHLFSHAATYFGDADAQYGLARMYLEGEGLERDPRLAFRWLDLAAQKGHAAAQATLGDMLVYGTGVPPAPEEGYMWLLIARHSARADELDWILTLTHRARETLSDDQRAIAEARANVWLEKRGIRTRTGAIATSTPIAPAE